MPKIVDHDQRREQLVDATWRLIERGGFEIATMREIAAEAGYAHGALQRYFPNKEGLLAAAFVRAHTRTNARFDAELGSSHGLAALRKLCLQIMPLDRERLQEARVVVAFWDHAIHNAELWKAHRENALAWRAQMRVFLGQARAAGDIQSETPDEVIIDQVSAMNAGFQVMSLLMPESSSPARQLTALDTILDTLRVEPT